MRWMELPEYIPVFDIFEAIREEEEAVLLDSSLCTPSRKQDGEGEREDGAVLGRYSIIGLRPYLSVKKEKDGFTVNGEKREGSFEAYLSRYLKEHREENPTGLPIVSGAIGYFSYEYGREKDQVPTRHQDAGELPASILKFYDWFLVEDGWEKKVILIANGKLCGEEESLRELQRLAAKGKQGAFLPENRREEEHADVSVRANFTREEYEKAVEQMIRYIVEGDIYIANMTQTLQIESSRPPFEVYRRLRSANPAPFGGYLDYGDFQVVMASPERFLKVKEGHVTTRPIKGTRKRGETASEDWRMYRELQSSEKDKSELLMIVDLERNDLNKACIPGSVKVTELFQVETYATVFHLVSNIEGDLEEGRTVMDLLDAAFPGGSITGAPKYRAMEIIDELERGKRGLYTGSVGYLSLDGSADLNIVIRTAVHRDGIYTLGVGGGITCESDPEFEYEETLQKAKAILEALS